MAVAEQRQEHPPLVIAILCRRQQAYTVQRFGKLPVPRKFLEQLFDSHFLAFAFRRKPEPFVDLFANRARPGKQQFGDPGPEWRVHGFGCRQPGRTRERHNRTLESPLRDQVARRKVQQAAEFMPRCRRNECIDEFEMLADRDFDRNNGTGR